MGAGMSDSAYSVARYEATAVGEQAHTRTHGRQRLKGTHTKRLTQPNEATKQLTRTEEATKGRGETISDQARRGELLAELGQTPDERLAESHHVRLDLDPLDCVTDPDPVAFGLAPASEPYYSQIM